MNICRTKNSQKVLHVRENLQMSSMQLEIAPVKRHEYFLTEL